MDTFDEFENVINENMACPNCGKHGEHKCFEPPAKKLCTCRDPNIVRLADCPIHGVGMEQPPVEVKDLEKVAEKVFEKNPLLWTTNQRASLRQALTESNKPLLLEIEELKQANHAANKLIGAQAQENDKINQSLLRKIEELEADTLSHRNILISNLDRDKDSNLTLNQLIVLAVNGIHWRDKQIQSQIVVMREALKGCEIALDTLYTFHRHSETWKMMKISDKLNAARKALTTDGSEFEERLKQSELKVESAIGILMKHGFTNAAAEIIEHTPQIAEKFKQLEQLSKSLELLEKAKEQANDYLQNQMILGLIRTCEDDVEIKERLPSSKEIFQDIVDSRRKLNETLTQIETFLKENGK